MDEYKCNYKYRGTITIACTNASVVEDALAPDNLSNMSMQSDGTTLSIKVTAQKLGTMINTVDDLLMNAQIACDLA